MNVQFDSVDIDAAREDFAVLGITAEFVQLTPMYRKKRTAGKVVACYFDWRSAQKLRDYLESHHCLETPDGKIATLPVDGWDQLVSWSRSLSRR